MHTLHGIGCSEGFSEGSVLVKRSIRPEQLERPAKTAEEELQRLEDSRRALDERLEALYDKTLSESGEEAAELIESYQMIAMDQPLFDRIRAKIRDGPSAPAAVRQVLEQEKSVFDAMEDVYLRERYADIEAVAHELIALCCGVSGALSGVELRGPTIVVADALTPVDTVNLDKKFLRGFVTEAGGTTSHAVILARTLGIPAVVGVQDITGIAKTGETICINGGDGTVLLSPGEREKAAFDLAAAEYRRGKERYEKEAPGPAFTKDGTRILLAVNSGDSDTADALSPAVCDGVGLFRTEFLYMKEEDYPDEETLFNAYRAAVVRMAGKPFIFRTLDIGGDKALGYMQLPREENPFLGYRAVRICLDRPALFRTQLRALLRASAYGAVQIMFPMITCLEELLRCRTALDEARSQLDAEGAPYRKDIPVGIMVETPAAVLVLDQLAPHVEFFSVGTNDLVQYLMAADRGNPQVQGLYDSFQISVLRALRHIGTVARQHGVALGVCGETASSTAMVPFLVGCGVEELSVAASALPRLRYLVRRLNRQDCEEAARTAVNLPSAKQAKEFLCRFAQHSMEEAE